MYQKVGCKTLILALGIFSGSSMSLAENLSITDLMELPIEALSNITIATRTSRSSSEIPSSVFVYSQGDIRRHGWNSLSELVQHVPGVDVVNKGRGLSLSVRGVGDLSFHGSKTVIMIDGHNVAFSALGSPGFGGFMNQYDILNAKRVEIQVGPGGTLHGANAFGIVINIITMDPESIDGFAADIFYGSQGEYIPSIRFGKRSGAWGWFQSFTGWRQTDSDLSSVPISQNPDSSLVVYNNDTFEAQTSRNYDLHGYVDYEHDLKMGYRISKVDSSRGTSLTSTQNGRVVVDQQMIYFDYTKNLSERLNYKLVSHYKKSRNTDSDAYFSDTTRNLVGVTISESDSLVLDNQLTFFQDAPLTWVGGIYLERSRQRPSAVQLVTGTTDPNDRLSPTPNAEENYDNGAGYLQLEWIPSDTFYLVTGLRYVKAHSQYPSEALPRFGMRYALSDKWLTKFNYQRGYRAPSAGEGNQRGTLAPNPDISSETIDSVELGLEGGPFSNTGLRLTYFYSSIQDLIGRAPYTGGGGFTAIDDNIGEIRVQGIELETIVKLDKKFTIETTFTYTDSINESTNQDTRTIVPYKLNLSFLARPAPRWEMVWDNYFRWKPNTDTSNALFDGENADDWLLSNLTVTRDQILNVKDLRLVLSVRNLFNEKYGHVDTRVTDTPGTPFLSSYHPQETRNVLLGLNYRFN